MATILLDSPDYLAVDKPEGLSCIPERDKAVPSLIKMLEEERGLRLYVVHRLDKEASGVIVYAKNAEAHRHLNDLFAGRKVEKRYMLLVHGVINDTQGTIDLPIREFGSGRMGVDEKRGKASITEFRVLERMSAATLVEAHPLTGRRHQLRVHFYARGNPLVGDLRYGDHALQATFPRLMLHAVSIAFLDRTGSLLNISCAVPEAFEEIRKRLTRVHNDLSSPSPTVR